MNEKGMTAPRWVVAMAVGLLLVAGGIGWLSQDGENDEERPGRESEAKIGRRPPRVADSVILSEESARPRREDAVEEEVARAGGPEAAAEAIRHDTKGREAERARAMESLTSHWAGRDPGRAWRWISERLAPEGGGSDPRDPDLWQAAVSGYVDGVVAFDPESAANAAAYLAVPGGGASVGTPVDGDPRPDDRGDRESGRAIFPGDPGPPSDPDFLTRRPR